MASDELSDWIKDRVTDHGKQRDLCKSQDNGTEAASAKEEDRSRLCQRRGQKPPLPKKRTETALALKSIKSIIEKGIIMAKKRILFVYNPKAGKGKIKSCLADIIEIFVREKHEVTVYPTAGPGDAARLVMEREKNRYDAVVCSGGDGTLNETVRGMMACSEQLPIGYIPAGSTNDFAHSLGISDNMLEAAEGITKGRTALYDIGSFNDNSFVYVAAFGAFTEVAYGTDQYRKNVLGHMAYILEGIKSISSIKSYRVKIEAEETQCEEDIILGMITNTTYIGGFKDITGSDVKLDDGRFEVILIRCPKNPRELNDMIVSLVSKKMNSDYIFSFKTSKIKIMSEEAINWTLDGEYGGSHKEAVIHNISKQLMLLS